MSSILHVLFQNLSVPGKSACGGLYKILGMGLRVKYVGRWIDGWLDSWMGWFNGWIERLPKAWIDNGWMS